MGRRDAEDYEALSSTYGHDDFRRDFGRGPGGGPIEFWRAVGCDACNGAGYKGRVGLHELLIADEEIKQAILHKAPVDEIRKRARAQGMKTLVQDGVAKALAGITDLKQVLSVSSR